MTSPLTPPFQDQVRPFQVEGLDVRGRIVRLGPLLDDMCRGHDYPAPVRALLGEVAALALVLASALKYDGIFTLQIQGSGPVGLVVVDVTSAGDMRGHARFDAARLAGLGDIAAAPVPRLLGAGHMAFTVDQGPDTDRYQGITGLEGATLSECAHGYFRQSEQMETAILLAADAATEGTHAGALMVQRLPGTAAAGADIDEDAWRRAVVLMSSLTSAELLDGGLNSETLLYRLYHEDGVRLFDLHDVRHKCRCSQGRVAQTLKSFPRAEIMELADKDADGHSVRVDCEFCKASYVFSEADLDALFAA